MNRIILLDIDGVLVEPRGYRAALRATVQHFVGNVEIKEDLITDLEKCGISSEWDMAPLIIASHWDLALTQHPMQNLPDDISAAARVIRSADNAEILQIPDFELLAGRYPAESAFHAGCFSFIPQKIREGLLLNTRDIKNSETMRIFQHFTLGSDKYEKTYDQKAEFDTESFLLKYDVSNVDDKTRTVLLGNNNHLAAFTARPSGRPCEVAESSSGYAPEAELALELVGLQNIPLIAFGKLEHIASKHKLDPAALLKPSPFQALAGILAAWTGNEMAALESACEWMMTGELKRSFKELPDTFELVVVEDTLGGIRSARAATEILNTAGFKINLKPLGVIAGDTEKEKIFETAHIICVDSIKDILMQL